jgi:hypothetical protein
MSIDVRDLKNETIEASLLYAAIIRIAKSEKIANSQLVIDLLYDDYSDIKARYEMEVYIKEINKKIK